MEQDDIGLYSQIAQTGYARFQALEEQRVESAPDPSRDRRDRCGRRAPVAPRQHSGRRTCCSLLKGASARCRQGLGHQGVRLLGPGIGGRADLGIGRAIGMDEMIAVGADADRAMIAGRGLPDLDGAGLAIQGRNLTGRPPLPDTCLRRTETYPVEAVAIIETGDPKLCRAMAEVSEQCDVDKGIATGRSLQGQFRATPSVPSLLQDWPGPSPAASMGKRRRQHAPSRQSGHQELPYLSVIVRIFFPDARQLMASL